MDNHSQFLKDFDLCDKLTENDFSILVNKQFTNLQAQNEQQKKPKIIKDEIEIIGRKVSCSSVWCQCCYVKKGGSKRFTNRLSCLNHQATRQLILTVDSKKFNGSGQDAYEEISKSGAINQFIYNMKRTSGVSIKDYVWTLEWHTNGFPHWHLFVETKTGKSGMIGNKILLKHWPYGLVRESYIKTKKHWDRFTGYFAENGYFNPKYDKTTKDKTHQLRLPEWALNVTYQIRRTGSMVKSNKTKDNTDIEQEKKETKYTKTRETKKSYKKIINSCGSKTSCYIRRGLNNNFNFVLDIPYKDFLKFSGVYVQSLGYVVTTSLNDFFNNYIPIPTVNSQ